MVLKNRKPLLVYDNACDFCRYWIAQWQHVTGGHVDYAPYQEVAAQFPEIPLSAFENSVNQAILKSGLALKKINIEFDMEKSSWEWIGYVAPQLGHWVTIHRENSIWHLSAVTEQCGVLKIIHRDLAAALTELKLVTNVSNGNI